MIWLENVFQNIKNQQNSCQFKGMFGQCEEKQDAVQCTLVN